MKFYLGQNVIVLSPDVAVLRGLATNECNMFDLPHRSKKEVAKVVVVPTLNKPTTMKVHFKMWDAMGAPDAEWFIHPSQCIPMSISEAVSMYVRDVLTLSEVRDILTS